MTTRVIRTPEDADKLAAQIKARGQFPCTVTVTKGEPRRKRQNRLAQRWNTDIAVQMGDMTHEDARAYNKLHFGVPILRAENEAFRLSYDPVMKHLPYEVKLEAMKALQLPVTSLMTVKQMTAYMDAVSQHWTPQGVRLTHPKDLIYQEEFS
jgi:hypothetical protein